MCNVKQEPKFILLHVDIQLSSSFGWRDYSFPIKLSWSLCLRLSKTINVCVLYLDSYIPLIYLYASTTLSHCLGCFSFVVSFEIGKCESINCVIFEDYFASSQSIAFLYEFQDLLVNFCTHTKKSRWNFVLNLQINLGSVAIPLTVLSLLIYEHGVYFNLF